MAKKRPAVTVPKLVIYVPSEGAFIDILGGYLDPVIRAVIATCVPMEELGKVYSLIAMCESLIPMFVPQIYSSLFKVMLSFVVITLPQWKGQSCKSCFLFYRQQRQLCQAQYSISPSDSWFYRLGS